MKIARWWKCGGCNLAYENKKMAKECHHVGIHAIHLLIGDDGKPMNPPTKLQRRNGVDEDETFGLLTDLMEGM